MTREQKHGELRPKDNDSIRPGPRLRGLLESLEGLRPEDQFSVLSRANRNGTISFLCEQDIRNHPEIQGKK